MFKGTKKIEITHIVDALKTLLIGNMDLHVLWGTHYLLEIYK